MGSDGPVNIDTRNRQHLESGRPLCVIHGGRLVAMLHSTRALDELLKYEPDAVMGRHCVTIGDPETLLVLRSNFTVSGRSHAEGQYHQERTLIKTYGRKRVADRGDVSIRGGRKAPSPKAKKPRRSQEEDEKGTDGPSR